MTACVLTTADIPFACRRYIFTSVLLTLCSCVCSNTYCHLLPFPAEAAPDLTPGHDPDLDVDPAAGAEARTDDPAPSPVTTPAPSLDPAAAGTRELTGTALVPETGRGVRGETSRGTGRGHAIMKVGEVARTGAGVEAGLDLLLVTGPVDPALKPMTKIDFQVVCLWCLPHD